MNNKTVNSVRSGLRHLALGTVVGSMLIAGVACGGSPEPSPSASSSTTTTTTTTTSTTTATPGESGSPSSSTGTQGASETVTVTDTGAETAPVPAGSPTPVHQPLVRPAQQQIVRDPFVNPLSGGGGSTVTSRPTVRNANSSTTTNTNVSVNTNSVGGGGTKPGDLDVPEEEVPPPDVTVTGIVQGTGGSRAIISGPEQSYIVGVGDKLAEYRVLAISPKAVTFGFKGHKFKVKIQDEFSSGAAGGKASPKGTK